ncbi:MAG: hypothetical protein ACK4RZ_03595 [Paracoccaceae bacterium]
MEGLQMFGTVIFPIIVFGAMLALCVIGLSMSNAQAQRLNATTPRPQPVPGRESAVRHSDTALR